MNIPSLDLNLLRVFDALMAERNTTRAGARVDLSQPAVSNALSRLRGHLQDELFLRAPGGLQPTPRAVELAGAVRRALDILAEALDQSAFDPATVKRRITILSNEYVSTVILPRLVGELAQAAPGIDLGIIPVSDRNFDLMDKGQADFAMSTYKTLPDRFENLDIAWDSCVLVTPADHPLAKGEISLEAYAAAKHILMSASGDTRGFVDSYLEARDLSRRVALVVNQFSVIRSLIKSANLVATVPKKFADTLGGDPDLVVREAPVQGPKEVSSVTMIWNRRLATHPAQRWFLDFVKSSLLNS